MLSPDAVPSGASICCVIIAVYMAPIALLLRKHYHSARSSCSTSTDKHCREVMKGCTNIRASSLNIFFSIYLIISLASPVAISPSVLSSASNSTGKHSACAYQLQFIKLHVFSQYSSIYRSRRGRKRDGLHEFLRCSLAAMRTNRGSVPTS